MYNYQFFNLRNCQLLNFFLKCLMFKFLQFFNCTKCNDYRAIVLEQGRYCKIHSNKENYSLEYQFWQIKSFLFQFLEEKILSTEKTTESLKIDVKNTGNFQPLKPWGGGAARPPPFLLLSLLKIIIVADVYKLIGPSLSHVSQSDMSVTFLFWP